MSKTGYKRPPEHTRFKKGVSGNPKGRPRGRKEKTTVECFDEVLRRRVPMTTAKGKQVRVSLLEATVLKCAGLAVNGDRHARKDLFDYLKQRGEFEAPPPSKEPRAVTVFLQPPPLDEWMEMASQTRLPLDPLEGLPGIDRNELRRQSSGRPTVSPVDEEDD